MVGRTILHGIRCARDGARGVRALPRNEPEKEGGNSGRESVRSSLLFLVSARFIFLHHHGLGGMVGGGRGGGVGVGGGDGGVSQCGTHNEP